MPALPAPAAAAFAALVAASGLAALPAHAESLRCNGHSVDVGDSRVAVLYKCGEPLLRDAYCAPLFVPGPLGPVPVTGGIAPCIAADEWLYERGAGEMPATVRFQQGRVQSIRYGRSPR